MLRVRPLPRGKALTLRDRDACPPCPGPARSPYSGNRLPGARAVVRDRLLARLLFTAALVIAILAVTALIVLAALG